MVATKNSYRRLVHRRRVMTSRGAIATYILVCLSVAGCSNRLAAIAPPAIDPYQLAKAAIEQYDTNGDGVIDKDELAAAPSLRFSQDRIDTNGDAKLDLDEIAQFVKRHWVDTAAGIIRVQCMVTYRGSPVDGAVVTLEPEAFMQETVKPASGTTRGGIAVLSVSEDDRPHPNARGVQNGFYLVRISREVNGQETIPEKYNQQTVLGCEVADRASYMPGPIHFNLD